VRASQAVDIAIIKSTTGKFHVVPKVSHLQTMAVGTDPRPTPADSYRLQ
jgi:hypothetical protein